MKKARTKKMRGLKRTSPPKPAEKQPQSKKSSEEMRAEEQKSPVEPAANKPAKTVAAKSERPASTPSNVLKTRKAPQQSPAPQQRMSSSDGATTPAEVDRWISMIREGGLDRKVKVKGKTGALLVR